MRRFARLLRAIARRSATLQRWRFGYYIVAYRCWARRRPVDRRQVAFLSDSRPGFSGNFAFLRDELTRQDPEAKVVAVFRPALRARRSLADLWRLPRVMATSRIILVDDFYPLIYPIALRRGSSLIQVWHAVGAFKKVGHSRAGLPGGPIPGSAIHRNYTWATVSAEAVRPDYAEAFGIDRERVLALGVPRTDAFFDAERVERARAAVRARFDVAPNAKIVLFAPTFRGNGQASATYDYDAVDWNALAWDLGPNWVVMVKMHPFVAPLAQARPGIRGIVDATHDREVTDLLMAADVLVTDYSSTIFEYALLRRPIVFFVPDLDEYTSSRDFYRPFEQYTVGPVITRGADLAGAIRAAAVDDDAIGQFVERFASACDGHSSRRIVTELVRPGQDRAAAGGPR